jgi:acetoin utilization deacetylase AcuC-like enzyme
MPPAPVLLSHPASLRHETGSHPEQAARIVAIERALDERGGLGFVRVASPAVEEATLRAVHPAAHIDLVRRAAGAGRGRLDADTLVSPGSFEAAAHAAGGAVALVDRLLEGSAPTGFSIHRPPGHHAEAARAMGFCLFNSVAVAARHAIDAHGCERVLVVDWDVHHGNGTNDIFHADPRVLFCSVHQSPLYPGTGPAQDVGSGAGRGFTVNLPVAPGSGDEVFVGLMAGVVVPLAAQFTPQLILISAGFDAHVEDPLAECRVTEPGYAAMTQALVQAGRAAGCPVGCVLEGGYALGALARSVMVTMEVLAGAAPVGPEPAAAPPLIDAARERLRPFWPGL